MSFNKYKFIITLIYKIPVNSINKCTYIILHKVVVKLLTI